MKFNRAAILLSGSMTVMAVASVLPIAQAQAQEKVEARAVIQRIVPVKNVPPALLAYWIDPKNNPAPTPSSPRAKSIGGGPTGANGEFVSVLPEGVKKVSPILAPHLGLMVVGTKEGVESVVDTITFLDQPLRQVELEAHFVILGDEDLKAFGVETGNHKTGGIELGFVRGNFQAALNKAVAENKASIFTAPRVTAINNMQAPLTWYRSHIVAQPTNTGNPFREISYEIPVTATINDDDTVTLQMEAKDPVSGPDQQTPAINQTATKRAVANMRDGDTVVLQGFLPLSQTVFGGGALPEGKNLVVFLTPRIVRHVEKTQNKRVGLVHLETGIPDKG